MARYPCISDGKSTERSRTGRFAGDYCEGADSPDFLKGWKRTSCIFPLRVTTQKGNPSWGTARANFSTVHPPRGPRVNPIKFTLHVAHHRCIRARPSPPSFTNHFLTTFCPFALRCFTKFTIEILSRPRHFFPRSSTVRSLFFHPSMDSLINNPITTRFSKENRDKRILAIYRME